MDISVEFLGGRFENPFILASAPPTASADMISRAFEEGWAGVVTKTLISEPVKNLKNRFASNKLNNQIYGFENIELVSENTPEQWYSDIKLLKQRFPEKIVIASIMGDAKDSAQWIDLAAGSEAAGADFLELNFSCPHGYPEKGKGSAIGQSAEYSSIITEWIKNESRIKVPVIVKLTAAVSDISYIGEAVSKAGADGICAINTFPSIMGFDLNTLKPKPAVAGYSTAGGYSGPGLKPIALRCVSDLAKSPGLPITACGGVSSGYDAVEFMLLGAPVVQVCTAVMLGGYQVIKGMKKELEAFMLDHKFNSVNDFLGVGIKNIRQFSDLDLNYNVKAKVDPDKCVGCNKCVVSCRDGGYQAVDMDNGKAKINIDKCTGCSLCCQVCPVNAIEMVEN